MFFKTGVVKAYVFLCAKNTFLLVSCLLGTRAQLEKHKKVLWRKRYVEEVIQSQELRENPCVFQLIPEQGLPSIRHPCYLLKGAKQPLLPLTSEINPAPAAYFPIKLLVVLLDIFPSALSMPLERILCKAWGCCVCKPKHCLCVCIYTSKTVEHTIHSRNCQTRAGKPTRAAFCDLQQENFFKTSWCFSLEIQC